MALTGEGAGAEIGVGPEKIVGSGWTAPPSKRFSAEGQHLPLVLLPGTLCDARVFGPVLSRVPQTDVLALSISGASSTAELAERLLSEAPPRFALAGFSLGGIVALEMAAAAPERIAGLALLNTTPLPVPPQTHAARREAAAKAARVGLDAYVRRSLWPQYVAPGARGRQDLLGLLVEMAEAIGPDAFALQTEVALTRTDRRQALRQLAAPILLLTGEHDDLCRPDTERELASTLPWARLAILPDVGHLSPLEAPNQVAHHLVRWLNDIDANTCGAATSPRQDRRRR